MLQFLLVENFVFFGGFLFMLGLGALSAFGGDLDADGGPDVDFDVDLDLDVDIDADIDGGFDQSSGLAELADNLVDPGEAKDVAKNGGLLGMIFPKGVPLTVVLALYALCFSVAGYSIQYVGWLLAGTGFPLYLAVPAALAAGWLPGRYLAGVIANNLLKTETAALGPRQMLGLTGEISIGMATPYRSAEVKVMDRFGNAQYLRGRTVPDAEPITGAVRIVGYRKDSHEYVIRPA